MLPEMRYIEQELLPMLRERAAKHEKSARKQLSQWKGEKGVCSLLLHVTDAPEIQKLPVYNNEEIHYGVEKMFVSQLRAALTSALADGDAVPSVRANVGCGALCTLFGGLKQTFFADKMPWLLAHMTADEIMETTVLDLKESDEFKLGLEQMQYMKEMLKGTGIGLFPMDLQGPIDMAHLFLGDEFFYLLYDDPEVVYRALELSVAAGVYAMEKCFQIIDPKEWVCHYNELILPVETPLKISEDTSTLLCGEHLEKYMKPYTERLLTYFGGGYIHYCGDNKHLLTIAPRIENGIGMNFGNPERHDAAQVLSELGSLGRCYYGRFPGMTPAEQARLARQENGWYNTFVTEHCRMDEQQRVIDEFNEAIR